VAESEEGKRAVSFKKDLSRLNAIKRSITIRGCEGILTCSHQKNRGRRKGEEKRDLQYRLRAIGRNRQGAIVLRCGSGCQIVEVASSGGKKGVTHKSIIIAGQRAF